MTSSAAEQSPEPPRVPGRESRELGGPTGGRAGNGQASAAPAVLGRSGMRARGARPDREVGLKIGSGTRGALRNSNEGEKGQVGGEEQGKEGERRRKRARACERASEGQRPPRAPTHTLQETQENISKRRSTNAQMGRTVETAEHLHPAERSRRQSVGEGRQEG